MSRPHVASRNAGRRRSLRAACGAAVLLGALGCGADAGSVAQRAGALEPASEASEGEASDEAAVEEAASDGERPGDPLVLPSNRPITEPPGPAPLPTSELQTTRPVNTTEPADVIVPPGECRFLYLGSARRCEGGDAVKLDTDAADLLSCMRLCLQRDDCGGVTDSLWLDAPDRGCQLHLSTCDAPVAAHEDEDEDDEHAGEHDFRRVCDGDR